ncbi:2Fe-2S iron-sulfur cluster-binding protein [Phenylobacterium sp. LjRoot219]|uniref:2Fe-2S iron-sulfur cluster-binding protein n=1 Tax=Phenylobacterium sp. LjRoot219 TaxID=3342283 RepID=UPI003ECEC678
MVRITYVEADGCEHTVEVKLGLSLMQGAVWNSVPGIVAECGGNCACGTCRVYVEEPWRDVTGQAADMEEATMEAREDPHPGKRLSCQIKVTEDLDGLVVRMPPSQF